MLSRRETKGLVTGKFFPAPKQENAAPKGISLCLQTSHVPTEVRLRLPLRRERWTDASLQG